MTTTMILQAKINGDHTGVAYASSVIQSSSALTRSFVPQCLACIPSNPESALVITLYF